MAEAKERGLYVAAPRGPSRSGRKRFGWGAPERALEAVKRSVTEARSRAGRLPLPVIVVGAGRGGKLGLEIAARNPGLFSAVGSVGGVFDPGPSGNAGVAGLRGVPVFLGVAKSAPPELYRAMRRGRESMEKLGVKLTWGEWPGSGEGLPSNATQAAKEILDALTRAVGVVPARAPRRSGA
jgi:predicted esterase